MKWKKLGLVFCPHENFSWMATHAMIPFAEALGDGRFRIYFSARDRNNKGHLGSLEIRMNNPLKIFNLSDKPSLGPGQLGCFDDSGVVGELVINIGGSKCLYYTGINLGITIPFRNSIGLARWNEELNMFERFSEGPIIDRTKDEPHFTATPEVINDEGIFKAWYTSCIKWTLENGQPKHYYHLKYAESSDGVNWCREGIVAVDFKDEHEYALGVPRVIKEKGLFKMWFCSRASAFVATYRIRYAESRDGRHWIRKDEEVGIDISESGWDSQMICYPFVFDYDGNRYMLYNGNQYGKSGFGIAILESD